MGVIVAVAGAFFVNVGRLSGFLNDESGRRKLSYAWSAVAIGCGLILLGLFVGLS
jgi:hypothetical protein